MNRIPENVLEELKKARKNHDSTETHQEENPINNSNNTFMEEEKFTNEKKVLNSSGIYIEQETGQIIEESQSDYVPMIRKLPLSFQPQISIYHKRTYRFHDSGFRLRTGCRSFCRHL